MRPRIARCAIALLLLSGMAAAQRPDRPGGGRHNGPPPPSPQERRPLGGPPGKWWDNPDMVRKLGLTAEQQRKMDDVFQQMRIRLIDLHAALQKEEAALDPLMQSDQPDDSKILPQIDRVAQARADLEKANARLLLGLRHVLTPDQWRRLQDEGRRHGPPPPAE